MAPADRFASQVAERPASPVQQASNAERGGANAMADDIAKNYSRHTCLMTSAATQQLAGPCRTMHGEGHELAGPSLSDYNGASASNDVCLRKQYADHNKNMIHAVAYERRSSMEARSRRFLRQVVLVNTAALTTSVGTAITTLLLLPVGSTGAALDAYAALGPGCCTPNQHLAT